MRQDAAPPDPELRRLNELLIKRTGLTYYRDKSETLWERVLQRLRQTGCASIAHYMKRLDDPVAGAAEWQALIAAVAIGETYFFRHREQFDALRSTVLPACIAANQATRRLRIWSAGCATGAEPYSVAIILRDLLGEAIADWHITIIGTDINEQALATARTARFGAWTLRSLSPEERTLYFRPVERDWQLRPRHARLVRFQAENLLDLLRPDAPLHFAAFDLILCRNVFIYFDPETVLRLVRALGGRLGPAGWLLLGYSEPNPDFATVLQPFDLPDTIAYRPRITPPAAPAAEVETAIEAGDAPPGAPPALPLPDMALPEVAPPARALPATARATPGYARLRPLARAVPRGGMPSGPGTLAAEMMTKADLGDYGGARIACQRAIAQDPTNPGYRYYAGLLAIADGAVAEAETAFRGAIYLDKNFALAHYHLGALLVDAGRVAPGRRFLANAQRLAEELDGSTRLTEGDGMTAAALAQSAQLLIEGLPAE